VEQKALIRLRGEGDIEWSTIVGGEVKLRTAKACVFCRHKFSGGPAAIRSHFLGEIKPILVKTCGTVQDHGIKAEWKDRHKEVLALLLCCLFGQIYINA
jgi:hypothetical protein